MSWIVGINMKPCQSELGRFIRERRTELGLSQEKLASAAKIYRMKIHRLEIKAGTRLNNEQISALALALYCEEEELKKRMTAVVKPSSLTTSQREELGRTIPPPLPGRPLYKMVGEVKVYISAHDHYHQETLRLFKREMLKSHPDIRPEVWAPGRIRKLIKDRKLFLKKEREWYAKVGLEPPTKSSRQPALSRESKDPILLT